MYENQPKVDFNYLKSFPKRKSCADSGCCEMQTASQMSRRPFVSSVI